MDDYNLTDHTYVQFPDSETLRWVWHVSGTTLTEYRDWLEEHAGLEQDTWYWCRGDRFAKGVYIKDGQVAIMFKLKFDLS